MSKIYDEATIAFQKLDPQPGSIVVVSFPADILHEQMLAFAEQLQPAVPEDVTILCTRAGVTVENIPQDRMNQMGWYKFDNQVKPN